MYKHCTLPSPHSFHEPYLRAYVPANRPNTTILLFPFQVQLPGPLITTKSGKEPLTEIYSHAAWCDLGFG
ncbi:hypothetical protein FBD94_00185 [Pedobacter hiemivivus]|uniref:Uncharacterized protein n=1 Tax=Pedobacter hiemivivus TaxID=2530454 RepID=A0A4V5PDK2_9SPHI|nr:hypothetical protein [Pedobacter hiemivivus]TKC65016.1 hypothetical protein FBD94_00185 [Pedobacter hiemivivus]